MFNLNRTLPKPPLDSWNANIRKNIATQRGSPYQSRNETANTYNRITGPAQLGSGESNRKRSGLGTLNLQIAAKDNEMAEAM